MRFYSLMFLFAVGCDNRIPDDVVPPAPVTSAIMLFDRAVLNPDEMVDGDAEIPNGTASSRVEADGHVDMQPEDETDGSNSGPIDQDGDGWFHHEDCDDLDSRIHPGAPEVCDGIDTNCDGRIDPPDSMDAMVWYRDADHDGFGLRADERTACVDPGVDWALVSGDCDDDDAAVHPDGVEVCDGVDNDCDGTVDPEDSEDVATWYLDRDADGFGNPDVTEDACTAPGEFWVLVGTDCNDDAADIFPGAQEFCDGHDGDCDGAEETGIASFFTSDGRREDVTEEVWERTYQLEESGTLRFCDGYWLSQLEIDVDAEADVVIEGIGDVVLDADAEGSVIEVVGELNRLEIRDLAITGGNANRGGGIYARTLDVVLDNVDIGGNKAEEYGGAIFIEEGNIELRASRIHGNTSNGLFFGGGGIYLGTGGVIALDSSFEHNRAEGLFSSGGALYTLSGSIQLTHTELTDNGAFAHGGALFLGSGNMVLDNASLEANDATNGGGAYVGGDVSMRNTLFLANQATASGGGLFLHGASSLICDALGTGSHGFLQNDADITGGAVQLASIEFSSITSNGCDWGAGISDNSGGDIRMAPFDVEAGLNAIFECAGHDCIGKVAVTLAP